MYLHESDGGFSPFCYHIVVNFRLFYSARVIERQKAAYGGWEMIIVEIHFYI